MAMGKIKAGTFRITGYRHLR